MISFKAPGISPSVSIHTRRVAGCYRLMLGIVTESLHAVKHLDSLDFDSAFYPPSAPGLRLLPSGTRPCHRTSVVAVDG
nr:MAG TPA: hypothetical protein [Caudoviricetes sp.]